jgi:hypothetical protein
MRRGLILTGVVATVLIGAGLGATLGTNQGSSSRSATPISVEPVSGTAAALSTAGAKAAFAALRSCYPDDTAELDDVWEQSACFEQRAVELAESSEPADLFNAAAAVVMERPDVFIACHDSGHKAADVLLRRFWDPTSAPEAQRAALARVFTDVNATCENGFVHGLFDTLGYLDAPIDSFEVAMQACQSAGISDCADGMGHAAWEVTGNLDEAVEVCSMLESNEQRVVCDGGIIMRMYQHLERDDPWYLGSVTVPGFSVSDWTTTVAAICDDWPATQVREAGPKQGCWAGVSYLLFKPVYSLVAVNGFDGAQAEIRDAIALAGQACQSFDEPGATVCFDSWDQYITFAANFDAGNVGRLCDALEPQRSQACAARALTRLDADVRRADERQQAVVK